jgi:transcriptional regulator with XRE-family HTH domain
MQVKEIVGVQICAARGALNWSVQELANRTGVGTATIVRYETAEGVPKSRKGNLDAIRSVFEQAGIEFIGAPGDARGIRIHIRKPDTKK